MHFLLAFAWVLVSDVIGMRDTKTTGFRVLEGDRTSVATSPEGFFRQASNARRDLNESLMYEKNDSATQNTPPFVDTGPVSGEVNLDIWQIYSIIIVCFFFGMSSCFLGAYCLPYLAAGVKAGLQGASCKADEHVHEHEHESEAEGKSGSGQKRPAYEDSHSEKEKQREVLLVLIACCSVALWRFSRNADTQTKALQKTPIILVLAWTNSASLMTWAIPDAINRYFLGSGRGFSEYFRNGTTPWDQVTALLIITTLTNWCYISSFHFVPASWSQAIYSASPLFTLFLSACVFPGMPRTSWVFCSVIVALTVCGVFLVCAPWDDQGIAEGYSRAHGIMFALFASVGSSLYYILFKKVFGNRLQLGDVCILLTRLGALSFVIQGLIFAAAFQFDAYPLDLDQVPWHTIALAALASAMFNFCKNLGLSKCSPLTIDIACQLGVTLSSILDVIAAQSRFDMIRGSGMFISIVSFFTYVWFRQLVRVD